MSRPFHISLLTVLAMVALRLVIGGHFFTQGLEKLDPGFSSAGFLSQAKGPLAEQYRAVLPDFHDWDRLMAQPREETPNPHESGSEEWQAAREAPYTEWQLKVVEDWNAYEEQAKTAYELDEEQQQEADTIFEYYQRALATYLDETAQDLAKYRHDLFRLQQLKESPTAEEVPFQESRVAKQRAETAAAAAGFQADVRALENDFHRDLAEIATAEQREVAGDFASSPGTLACIDKTVTYVVLGVGVCLILGLFTRLASVVGIVFLLSVVASQPFWLAGTAPTVNQWVELVALGVLATSHVGRWGGLDFFIHRLLVAPFRSKGTTDASN